MVAVQPDTQMVELIVAGVTAGLSAPEVRAGSGSPGRRPAGGSVASALAGGAVASGGGEAPGSSSWSPELASSVADAGISAAVGLAVGPAVGPDVPEPGKDADATATTGVAVGLGPVLVEAADEVARRAPTMTTATAIEAICRRGTLIRSPATARSAE